MKQTDGEPRRIHGHLFLPASQNESLVFVIPKGITLHGSECRPFIESLCTSHSLRLAVRSQNSRPAGNSSFCLPLSFDTSVESLVFSFPDAVFEPWAFYARDLDRFSLVVDLTSFDHHAPKTMATSIFQLASGALAAQEMRRIATKSWPATSSIALIGAQTDGTGIPISLGSFEFEILVVSPFSHPNMKIGERHMYWKTMETKVSMRCRTWAGHGRDLSPRLKFFFPLDQVIGHRGSGADAKEPVSATLDHTPALAVSRKKRIQIGENTVLSFVTAASLGAEYVEFGTLGLLRRSLHLSFVMLTDRNTDVQMTKDGIPVLYHDWVVSESGLDLAVNDLTLDQFRGFAGKLAGSVKRRKQAVEFSKLRGRTMDDVGNKAYSFDDMSSSLRGGHFSEEPFAHRKKGVQEHVMAPFPTLEEALKVCILSLFFFRHEIVSYLCEFFPVPFGTTPSLP
jgi:hypothetical protein